MPLQPETQPLTAEAPFDPADCGVEGVDEMWERPDDTMVECTTLGDLFDSNERVSATAGAIDLSIPGRGPAAESTDSLTADDVEGLRVDGIERMFETPVDRSAIVWEGLEEFFSAVQTNPVDYAARFDEVIATRVTTIPAAGSGSGSPEPPLPSVASVAGDFQKFAEEFHRFAEACQNRSRVLQIA